MTHVLCDLSVTQAACDAVSREHSIPGLRLPLKDAARDIYDVGAVSRSLVSLN